MSAPASSGTRWSNTVIIGGLFALAAALGVHELTHSGGLGAGSPAPELALQRLDGRPTPLEGHRGKVVLLNFWATWCQACNAELPELVALARAYEAKGVVFIAANAEWPSEPRPAVEHWLEQHSDVRPYVALTSPEAIDAYALEALPTTYVIDSRGAVVDSAHGRIERWQLEKWLDDALAR